MDEPGRLHPGPNGSFFPAPLFRPFNDCLPGILLQKISILHSCIRGYFFCCEGKRYTFFIREFVAIFFAAKAKDINSSFVNSWLFFSAAKAKDIHSSFVNSWLFFLRIRAKREHA
jgi:hypothetical protein